MGIKHLSSWFIRALPQDALKRIDTLNPVHTLAVDLNDVLHRAVNQADDCENQFYNRVLALLNSLIQRSRPRRNIGLFLDGVAPSAKLLLQIKRRRANPPSSMFDAPLFSGLALTPGTPVMRSLADLIRSRFLLSGHNVHFSCSDEPGEGEVKIVKWIRNLPRQDLGNVLIIGADADFLPIACMQQELHQSRICLDMPNYQTVPIQGFNQFLLNDTDMQKGRKEDISILLMMLGNDYLPKLAGLTPDVAISAYRAAGFPRLVQHRETGLASLNRDNFVRLFELLYPDLHMYSRNEDDSPDDSESLESSDDSDDIEIQDFFQGIAWMATMYYTGECPDYTFRLQNKSTTISVSKCLNFLKNHSSVNIESPISSESPLDADLAQLVMMPLWGRSMVQPYLQAVMDPDSELGYYYHHPCHICAGYRQVIRTFQESAMRDDSPEAAEFRRNISREYAFHMHEAHSSNWLSPPIEHLRSQLNRLRASNV